MISILIPIHNWDSTNLINSLVRQGNSVNVPYEIIAIDDFSNSNHDVANFSMNQYDFVQVFRNEKNFGRSKTRNLLASKAKYDWLLFIDCDSYVEDGFLINYIKEIKTTNADVICGGTIYSDLKPSKKEYHLHWKYGKQREARSVDLRRELKFKGFASNNFAIKSLVFFAQQFDESLTEYGHEDTLFGKQLSVKNFAISHIQNPVKHLGLVTNSELIKRSEKAIENLVYLYRSQKLNKEDVELLTQYYKRKSVVKHIGSFSKEFAKERAEKQSMLFFYDFYRLIYLTEKLINFG